MIINVSLRLVETLIGGLKPEISDDIRMFKPKSLKEAINLARMKADQVQRKFSQPFLVNGTPMVLPALTNVLALHSLSDYRRAI